MSIQKRTSAILSCAFPIPYVLTLIAVVLSMLTVTVCSPIPFLPFLIITLVPHVNLVCHLASHCLVPLTLNKRSCIVSYIKIVIYRFHALYNMSRASFPKTNRSERTQFQKRVVEVIMKWEGSKYNLSWV